MPEQTNHPTLRDSIRVLRRRAWVLVLFVVIVPAAALTFSLTRTKEYSASASLLFRDPGFDQRLFGSTFLPPSQDANREAATNLKLVSLRVVADRAARRLGGGRAGDDISGMVLVRPEGQSDVVSVTATDHVPAVAARVANTFAEEYIAYRREADRAKIKEAELLVESELNDVPLRLRETPRARSLRSRYEQLKILASLQTGNAELAQRADVPEEPSAPKPVRNTIGGLFLGILLGSVFALLYERLDRRIRDSEEVADTFGSPVLGMVPVSRTIPGIHDPRHLSGREAEAFRMLRANLRFFNATRQIRSVLVTSPSPGDGKSTVAWSLAAAAAGAGTRTLLIEGDLRRPSLGRTLGAWHHGRGLSQVMAGELNFEDVLERVPVAERRNGARAELTMDVLFSGPPPPNPTEMLESDRMRELLIHAQATYDLVIIDSPPIAVVPDAIPLIPQVSGVLVVSRVGHSTRDAIRRLHDQLTNMKAPTLGIVVNGIRVDEGGYYGYYGYESGARNGTPTSHADQFLEADTTKAEIR